MAAMVSWSSHFCTVSPAACTDALQSQQHRPLQVSVGAYATAGRRGQDRMEDTHVVASPLPQCSPTAHLLAAFDGHRGTAAALHCSEHLQQHLLSQWQRHSACEDLLKASAAPAACQFFSMSPHASVALPFASSVLLRCSV